MKTLTTVLLTLLVLGGCSQEPTELERCIEANTDASVPSSFNLKWFYLKACFKSAFRSSISSNPTEIRTKSWVTPVSF